MPTLVLETVVEAPPERVFDLARSVECHTEPIGGDERTIDGTAEDRLELGDVVTRRGRHFGLPVELTVQVTQLETPRHFRDKQVDGPFERLVHDHYFERTPTGGTLVRDELRFDSPLGPLGTAVDAVVLENYLRSLLEDRNAALKASAERQLA